ncbi:MAG: 3-deoxy-manno-octulosonate cytidylyltransferase [Bacteroidetes bacterium]|nr:3-deoxy-manno-octulosonate cytidylyltransferase [Bacteroidota bacterium]MDA0903881.1 3-deoxy-manno-octulosonate cytidylyltransferase [Bacteroidota bacterium]MDA1243180.1 3-deoxy-manno-octulosonate cytidylyltransferase [Bacteroidota bacterium]
MNILAVIPARHASTRFPGKPLASVAGLPMIQRVHQRVVDSGAFQRVVVATDDIRIANVVSEFNGEVIMTSVDCPNGTVRCHEAAEQLEALGHTFDAVVNVQGDEPFVHPEQLQQLADMLHKPDAAVVTLAKSMPSGPDIQSPHRVKVVRNMLGRALMFSRNPIPSGDGPWLQHIGLYGFTRTALEALVQLSPTALEKRERLEQLRWLDHGWRIDVGTTAHMTPAVDTPEDLIAIEHLIAQGHLTA